MTLSPGLRTGVMRLAPSKSHAHRVLIAEFLSGRMDALVDNRVDCDDIAATKRCLRALAARRVDGGADRGAVVLDVGESGTTRRLLGPVVAALGVKPSWIMRGRLASRPQIDYSDLRPGVQELPGDVSSQFVSGLLFALPLLNGDSEIRLMTPLASRGYVDMTLDVLKTYGIVIGETANGFTVAGRQTYIAPAEGCRIEGDWSGAAFILAMKALGNDVTLNATDRASLREDSLQPDQAIVGMLEKLSVDGRAVLDVDACPDIFPILTVVAACRTGETLFTGTRRLKIKESDRTAAMAEVLAAFGVETTVDEETFLVHGAGARGLRSAGAVLSTRADHRIAMSIAVAATRAAGPVALDNTSCAAKSFPTFFEDFAGLACGSANTNTLTIHNSHLYL